MTKEKTNCFHKNERLKGEIRINELFSKGEGVIAYPIRAIFIPSQDHINKSLISVPKKRFKKAIARNKLKRRMKEALRLNKSVLYLFLKEKNIALDIAFIYVSDDILPFSKIEKGILSAIDKIKNYYD